MRKLVFGLGAFGAIVAVGSLAWASSATIPAPSPNHSPIEKAACGGPGPGCPWGRTWLGVRALSLLVRSLRRRLLVSAHALLASPRRQ
jgi:hypothetical protein